MFRIRNVIAVATPLLFAGTLAAPPAHADHTRPHTCEEVGGVFTAGATRGADRCVVTEETSITGPFGRPTTTVSEPRPDDTSPIVVDGPVTPTGEPTTASELRDVGEPSSVVTVLSGTPTTTERTERGTPTSTDAPGTRNCERVNNENAKKPVEKCERTVVTTTTTPTTVFTTVTTPQTERTVTTQAREECRTTTQQTSFVRTTTQGQVQDRTVSYQQRTITTTTTTTYRFDGRDQLQLVVFPVAPNPRITTRTEPAEPLETTTTEPIQPSTSTETLPGEPIVTGPTCTPTAPAVTETERELEPLSVETSRPGEPVVTTSTSGTGQTCYNNPSSAEQRRNACS
ncbi:hypothetical protein BJF77_12620 [Kocuria sp. CNJ-770]|uniref:hypothetical protein n=1 Tax=Kocuria sp. CNJ-770 TaxID=1904964 RepID=UPI000959F12D|nr:hypothetical protein [Kocuria sp. CNJ-770]OLT08544.1 hypothetical protein BJF77_12620 [Kocuria sp. CNJ-770]